MRYKRYWFTTDIITNETFYKLKEEGLSDEEKQKIYAKGLLDKLKDLKEYLKDVSTDEVDGMYYSYGGSRIYVCIKKPSGQPADFTNIKNAALLPGDLGSGEKWYLHYIANKPKSEMYPFDIDEEIKRVEEKGDKLFKMYHIELTTNEKIKVYPDTTSIRDIMGGMFDICGRIMVELSPDKITLKPPVNGGFTLTENDIIIDFCCDDFALVNENIKKYNALADLLGVKGYYGNLVLYALDSIYYGRGFNYQEVEFFANALNKLANKKADYIKELHSKYDNMSSNDRQKRVGELTPKNTRLEQFLKEHPEFKVYQM